MNKTIGLILLAGIMTAAYFNNTSELAFSSEIDSEFVKYIAKYRKSYASSEEFGARKEIFANAFRTVQEQNAKEGETWFAAINQFSDQSQEEFEKYSMGLDLSLNTAEGITVADEKTDVSSPPAVDHRGKINSPKNQGKCGSCWAFAATGAIEGAIALKTGNKV